MNPNEPPSLSVRKDEEQLRLLATFHYVVAGIGAFFACFPLIHVVIGVMMIVKPAAMGGTHAAPPPAALGYLFAGMGTLFVLMGWGAAVCTFVSGRYLARRRKRMFSFVVAAFLCAFVPFGTVLGVFTIIVLSRDSVQRLYELPA